MLFTNYASLVAIDAGIPLTIPCLHRCSIRRGIGPNYFPRPLGGGRPMVTLRCA